MIKDFTGIKKVALTFNRENHDSDLEFESEVDFYTGMKAKNQQIKDDY